MSIIIIILVAVIIIRSCCKAMSTSGGYVAVVHHIIFIYRTWACCYGVIRQSATSWWPPVDTMKSSVSGEDILTQKSDSLPQTYSCYNMTMWLISNTQSSVEI